MICGSGKISILISCYNQRDLIGQAIRSFFEQDYENREIIVLDDGSSDDSMAVIASAAAEGLPSEIRWIQCQRPSTPHRQ